MKYLAIALLPFLLIACSDDEDKESSPSPEAAKSLSAEKESLHQGSAPIVTTGDEKSDQPKETPSEQAPTGDALPLRVQTILDWKKGDPIPSEVAIAAANKALKDAKFAESEAGKAITKNLLRIKAAKLKARKPSAGSNGSGEKNLPATPSFNRSSDSPTKSMVEPGGDILVKNGIDLALEGNAMGEHAQALSVASNLTKARALAYAADLLIELEASSETESAKTDKFESLARFLTEAVEGWGALNDDWREFLSFNIAGGVDRTEMTWRYAQAWILLEESFE